MHREIRSDRRHRSEAAHRFLGLAHELGELLERLDQQVVPTIPERRSSERNRLRSRFVRLSTALEHAEPLPMLAVSRLLEVPPSTATRTIDRLVEMDLVDRSIDPGDGRVVLVRLTERGRDLYERLRHNRLERVAESLGALEARERQDLIDLLGTAVKAIRRSLLNREPGDVR